MSRPDDKGLIEARKNMNAMRGVVFPIKRTIVTYRCERCGNEYERFETDRSFDAKCLLARCQGTVITKFIRLLKGEEIYSYVKEVKRREIVTEPGEPMY